MDYRLLALAVMVLWGVQNVFLKLVLQKVPALVYFLLGAVATLLSGIFVFLLLRPRVDVGPTLLAGAFVLALASAFVYLLFLYTLSKGPANIVVPITSLNITVTALLATLFLGEPLTFQKGLGVLLAAIAVVLLTLQA